MPNPVDAVFRTRSLGTASSGIIDQYSDGQAAKLWGYYIGETDARTMLYKDFLVSILTDKKCKNVLDAACGTGVDSIMLLEQGFSITSTDASDKMLKKALKTRWDRRKEPFFEDWVIEEGNWLTLVDDITLPEESKNGFDAIICMGNSFAHMPDSDGQQTDHIRAITNFYYLLKPGGILVIDHRNYDQILDHGVAPSNSIYYNCKYDIDLKTSVLYYENKPNMVILDYSMSIPEVKGCNGKFRLSYYPHRLTEFKRLLKRVFGSVVPHQIYADFKPLRECPNPTNYIHIIEKES